MRGNVELSPLFSDHAVLQRDLPIRIWGRGTPGEQATIRFHGQVQTTIVAANGRWEVKLASLPADPHPAQLTVEGRNRLVCTDIVLGEVWLCCDQAPRTTAIGDSGDVPLIRELTIPRAVADQPSDDAGAPAWQSAHPSPAGEPRALGYDFARELGRKLQVPIGVIHCAWSGTPVYAWIPAEAMRTDTLFAPVQRWHNDQMKFRADQHLYQERSRIWEKAAALLKAQPGDGYQRFLSTGTPRPVPPVKPHEEDAPSGLFNAMIFPVSRYTCRGVVWRQSESAAEEAEEYSRLFPALIEAWREQFQQPDLPIFWVSRPGFDERPALALRETGEVDAMDMPGSDQTVARRLAVLALDRLYRRASLKDTASR